jgi:thymidine phosphorylase
MKKRIYLNTSLGGRLLLLVNKVETIEQGREMICETFKNGTALKKFHDMIIGQGVSKIIADQLINQDETMSNSILKLANVEHRAIAFQTGFIQSIDSFKLGTIVQRLGMVSFFLLSKNQQHTKIFSFRWWSIKVHR